MGNVWSLGAPKTIKKTDARAKDRVNAAEIYHICTHLAPILSNAYLFCWVTPLKLVETYIDYTCVCESECSDLIVPIDT